MKLTFYCDVYQTDDPTFNHMAFTRPTIPRPNGAKRYKFSIELPDPNDPDVDLGTVPAEEVE